MIVNQAERQRLLGTASQTALPHNYMIFRLTAVCAGDAQAVLARCKEVLAIVLSADPAHWPSVSEWRLLLPTWFVIASAEEITQEEAERRLDLSLEERRRLSQKWAVSAFVHWLKPEERYWYWWNAAIEGNSLIRISIIAEETPFPWGALGWLLRASGALRIEEE